MEFPVLSPKHAGWVAAGLIGLAVWALRVALVGDLGTGIPWMDQWIGEGLAVYEPWLQGQLAWRDIFEPHLEHRIVWTHLWNLGLLELCGQWEPMVQMVAQAGITAATAGVCVWVLLPIRTEWYWRASVLVGAVLAFGLFFAYENILWGYQSQFGFLTYYAWGFVRPLHGCGGIAGMPGWHCWRAWRLTLRWGQELWRADNRRAGGIGQRVRAEDIAAECRDLGDRHGLFVLGPFPTE